MNAVMDYLPSNHSALQIINLDEFTKTTGVVVVGCFSITKGLQKTRGRQGGLLKDEQCIIKSTQYKDIFLLDLKF